MKKALTLAGRTGALTFLAISSVPVFAGGIGSITYSPDIAGVPMLGGIGLMVLSGLLGLVSLRFLKDRSRHGSTFVIAATLTGAITAAGGGFKLISDAQADSGVLLSKNEGGTVTIPFDGYNTIINDTSVPQQIKNIIVDEPCFLEGPNGGDFFPPKGNGGLGQGGGKGGYLGLCNDEGRNGTVLQPNDRCDVFVCCPGSNGGDNGGLQGGNGGLQGGNGGGCFVPI